MNQALAELLKRQVQHGLPDLDGAEAAMTIPIAERLLTEAISASLPDGAPVREVQVRAEESDRIVLRITLARASFLPPIPITLVIHEQPALPDHPFLTLRISQSAALIAIAERALKHVPLPAGVSLSGDRIHLDIQTLLAARNLEYVLPYLTQLDVHTRPGAVVLSVRARVRRA